jgi:teichuronic acid exporter
VASTRQRGRTRPGREERAAETAAAPASGSDNARFDRALVRGIAWIGGLRWLSQLVTWSVALVVARLIQPAAYGLFAMAVVYTGFVQLVNQLGLDIALVQQRDLAEDEIAALGGLTVLAGLGFCALSIVGAPWVAHFFRQPTLRAVIAVLSATFVIRGFQVVPRAILARELNFRVLAWINTLESGVWSATTVVGALLGLGYWALVAGALTSALAALGVLWWLRPHRLAWPSNIRAIARTTRLGWYIVVAQLSWYIYDHVDLMLVGRALGRVSLGAYSWASNIADVPLDRVSNLVGQVTPAVFAAAQTELDVLRRHVLGLTEALAIVTFPIAAGLALTADVFVVAVLGDAWRPAIVPLRLLGLLGGFRAVFNLLPQTLIATGHAKLNAQFNVLMAIGVTAALATGLRWGSTGVAVAWIVAVPLIAAPTFFRSTLRILGVRSTTYLKALWPATSGVALVAVAVIALRLLLPSSWSASAVLASCVAIGAPLYVAVLRFGHEPRTRALAASVRHLRDEPSVGLRSLDSEFTEAETLAGQPSGLPVALPEVASAAGR